MKEETIISKSKMKTYEIWPKSWKMLKHFSMIFSNFHYVYENKKKIYYNDIVANWPIKIMFTFGLLIWDFSFLYRIEKFQKCPSIDRSATKIECIRVELSEKLSIVIQFIVASKYFHFIYLFFNFWLSIFSFSILIFSNIHSFREIIFTFFFFSRKFFHSIFICK